MNKIIMLDIDWVLINSQNDMKNWTFNEKCVENLEYIISKTWAKIVISSSWRHNIESLKKTWFSSWLSWDYIIWVTPSKTWWGRDEEIRQWLEWNSIYQSYTWIAIDDEYFDMKVTDFLWNLVRTDFETWLTRPIAEYCIQKLNYSS